MSKYIDYYNEIKEARKFFNEEDYEYSSEEILLMKELTNAIIAVIKKNPQTAEEFININYKILKKYGMNYFLCEKLENIADENINISKKDLLKLNKYCISLQSQGSINDYVSKHRKHRKIDGYIWFNVVGILYPTNIEHKKIVKHMKKNVRIKSIQRGYVWIIIPKKILNDFLHFSDNNDLFCYVTKNGIKNKKFEKYLKENKILKNKEINFSFKKLEKSENIICRDFDLKNLGEFRYNELNIVWNIVRSHSDQLSDDEIVKLALKSHKIKKMIDKEIIDVEIISPYFYEKEDKFFIQRVTKTLKMVSSKKEFKKDDNKIRIRCSGEYECNGKTYVMPENFRKYSEYFLKSLLKLDNNQIRMHYIDVVIPTDEFRREEKSHGSVELLDELRRKEESKKKEMLHIINYYAGVDGSFYTTKKFNIFDKTPNNIFGELESEGLIEHEVHELKITNNFGEIFTLKRDCEIKIDSHLI